VKLATLKNGTRDGALVVISQDLSRYAHADHIVSTLQEALDDWDTHSPALNALADVLNTEENLGQTFDQAAAMSPLPRAYQWLDGSAYVNHVELVRRARGATMPDSFWTDPLMYQGGSDTFLAPHDPIRLADEQWGIDMEGEVAVIVDDVPMGSNREAALAAIRLIMLVNDVSLRALIPSELGKGFGFVQSKPSSAFSPVAITPDELGSAWKGGKVHLPLLVFHNNAPLGKANAGEDMTFDFGELISHAAKSRDLCAGTIIGSGTVSNRQSGGPGQPINLGGVGYSCLAEIRVVETLEYGKPKTPFMGFGDTVRIEMNNAQGQSLFGVINQTVVPS
jgi:fumarylacetoacetate (FAA) hydrolase